MTKINTDPSNWVALYGDMLFNYAFTRVSSVEIAEDLVQETFLAGLRNIDGFREDSSLKTWLVAILKRKIIDYYRKKSRQNESSNEGADEKFMEDGHWKAQYAPKDWSADLNLLLDSEEFLTIFQACLGRLPDKWSACFTMKNLDDYRAEDICKELEISSSNYWVILHRARLRLRECLEKNWLK